MSQGLTSEAVTAPGPRTRAGAIPNQSRHFLILLYSAASLSGAFAVLIVFAMAMSPTEFLTVGELKFVVFLGAYAFALFTRQDVSIPLGWFIVGAFCLSSLKEPGDLLLAVLVLAFTMYLRKRRELLTGRSGPHRDRSARATTA